MKQAEFSEPLEPTHRPTKPLLRGYFHAIAAVLMLAGTVVLGALSAQDRQKQISFLIYGGSCLVLFGMSATYHIFTWAPRQRALLRRMDHANIFLLIAGTYTPVAFNVLTGGWRIGVLAAVWVLALGGMLLAALPFTIPRWLSVGLYLLTGWVALAALPQFAARLGSGALVTLAAGGVLYSLGAVTYAVKRPALWPRVFGYHELFHLFTIAANAVFFAFMLIFVLPVARG